MKPYDDTAAHLEDEFRRLDLPLRLCVQETGGGDGVLGAGSSLSQATVTELLTTDDQHEESVETEYERQISDRVHDSAEQITRRIEESREAGVELRFASFTERFDLSRRERDVLVLALAPEVDERYGAVYSYLRDGRANRRPTVGIVRRVLARGYDERFGSVSVLSADSPLREYGFVGFGDEGPAVPRVERSLYVDSHLVEYLLGLSRLDELLAPHAEVTAATASVGDLRLDDDARRGVRRAVESAPDSPTLWYVHGPAGSDRGGVVSAIAAERGARRLRLDGTTLSNVEGVDLVTRIHREARLHGAALQIDDVDTLLGGGGGGRRRQDHNTSGSVPENAEAGSATESDSTTTAPATDGAGTSSTGEGTATPPTADETVTPPTADETVTPPIDDGKASTPTTVGDRAVGDRIAELAERLGSFDGDIYLTGSEPWTPSRELPGHAFERVAVGWPSYALKREVWETHADDLPATVDPATVASKFDLTPGQIEDAVATARHASDGERLTRDAVYYGCRAQSAAALREHADKIQPTYDWDDIVLPEDRFRRLREVAAHINHRGTVYSEWGFGEKFSLGNGLAALFSGSSGTGKTMAAEVIANDAGLDLYRIDLANVVSKYIGETESNLEEIFDEAANTNALLLFDEADALFGKRSDVSDAQDRYANVEVNYLLQRIEDYEGAVILTSNLEQNIDDAFRRRLDVTLDFPRPTEQLRQQIWEGIFPDATPTEELDYEFLATFEVTGGNIRNAAETAAFLAADDEGVVRMDHMITAMRLELQKLGKLLSKSDFGDYAHLL